MSKIKTLFLKEPFSLNEIQKNIFYKKYLNKLTKYHFKNSKVYRKLIKNLKFKIYKNYDIHELPFIPVSLFKKFELFSVNKNKIIKILKSSGTTGDILSKIYLDRENSMNQVKALQKIMFSILGKDRLPMLVVDKNISNIDRSEFGARVAAINGFSIYGKKHTFLLDDKSNINYNLLNKFLKNYGNKKFLVFGFTSIVYQNLIKKLNLNKLNRLFDNAILIHGGGWKKLQDQKISNNDFKKFLSRNLNINMVHNYYGLVEQTGSIFLECKCGYFITSNFSDIFIRDENFLIQKKNTKGFVQLISVLPTSYPGHNIITEDVGEIIYDKKCRCVKNGKRFIIHGRIKEAEIRGCSDT